MRKCLFLLSVLFFAFFIIGCGTESQVIIKPEFTGRHVEVIREVSEESEAEPEVWFCPRDNCSSHLAGFINNAEESVHCAVFDLDLADVIDALQSKQKSIDVKVVVDNDNSKILEDLSFIRFDDKNQLSHNKFCVIDGKIVWTGSFNPTERCNFKNNNNAVVYESRYLAKNYEDEFNELWNGMFGKGEKVGYPLIKLNGKLIENYFCPEDRCADKVIEAINSAEKSVYFMTFSFTHDYIGNALISKHRKGIVVKGVFEKSQTNKGTEFDILQQYGIDVKEDKNSANMHHKVFIIDNEIVITGSFNPSTNADTRNDENLLIIHDASVAGSFLEEFENVYIE